MLYDKKKAPFYILEILKEYTDSDHPLKQVEIAAKLNDVYNIEMERKTISTTIDLLIDLGYDINKDSTGVYLNEREFDDTQIKFLVDAIYSSKIITSAQANEISKKLYASLSKYKRKDYNYIFKSTELSRTNNNDFFYNIDIINEAINNKKKITFSYLNYDNTGKLIKKNDGHTYKVSPYYLVNNFGKYYLLCNIGWSKHTIFRVDYIVNIDITDDDVFPIKYVKTLGENFNINEYLNDHVYMFGSEVINAKIKIINEEGIQDTLDWFGKNAYLRTENEQLYAYVKSDDMALLYWSLQYMESVEIVEPIELRMKIKDLLNKTIEHYNN